MDEMSADDTMRCPGCGQDVVPVQRYTRPGVRWYQFSHTGRYCPKCGKELVLVLTRKFKVLYQLSIMLMVLGGLLFVSSRDHPGRHQETYALAALLIGALLWLYSISHFQLDARKQDASTDRKE